MSKPETAKPFLDMFFKMKNKRKKKKKKQEEASQASEPVEGHSD